MIRRAEDSLVAECGIDFYKEKLQGVIFNYHMGMFWIVLHCSVLYMWLYFGQGTRKHYMVWCVFFGIPHILNPMLLTMHIAHVIHMFVARLDHFQMSIARNSYNSLERFWDTFCGARKMKTRLDEELNPVISFFCFILLGAILIQGLTVLTLLKNQFFSIIYMISNVVMLLFILFEAQRVNKGFEKILWEINYLPIDSVLGDFNSPQRNWFQKFSTAKELMPSLSLKIFDFMSVDNTFFYQVLTFCFVSLTTVISTHFKNVIPRS
jgi:hypothetical protein